MIICNLIKKVYLFNTPFIFEVKLKIKNDIKTIKDSTYTKDELNRQLRISGLEAEKRMIQATDRKLLDVRRQTEIEDEIKRLNTK